MNKFEYKKLTPFKWFVLENFPFIEADFDALTEWQLFCKLGKEMNKIITSENTLGTQMENVTNAFIELQNYINNYFDNLDVQEEINNKLNEMAESGELLNLITQYLNSNALLIFNNISDLQNSNSLIIGANVKTLGYYNYLDGGGSLYKIIEKPDIITSDIIEINNDISAKLIIENGIVNVKQFGAKGNNLEDDTTYIQNAFDFCMENDYNLYFPNGIYKTTRPIGISTSLEKSKTLPTIFGEKQTGISANLANKELSGAVILYYGKGEKAIQLQNTNKQNFFVGGSIKDISILNIGDMKTDGSIGLYLEGCIDYRLYNVSCIGFNYGFYNKYGWSFDCYGLICVRNTIGIYLDDNSNACGFFGSQIHQNEINVKIVSGVNIDFEKATLEGGGTAVVITSQDNINVSPANISFKNCYLEANRRGFLIGKDENNITSDKIIDVINISNINIDSAYLDYVFEFDNTRHINISNIRYGQPKPLYTATNNTLYVEFKNLGNKFYNFIQNRNMLTNKTGTKNGFNLAPNGFMLYPYLNNLKNAGFPVEIDTTTFPRRTSIKNYSSKWNKFKYF